MLGYVICERPELKMKDWELYNGYYCGVCKSISDRYGQLPRIGLSYDAAFLALLLAGLDDAKDDIRREHCIAHHIQKKTVIQNSYTDYAADIMLMLAWFKAKDDVNDDGSAKAKAASVMFRSSFNKARSKHPAVADEMKELLDKLSALENDKCESLDQVSDCFGRILEILLAGGGEERSETETRILRRFGYHLGKWIYLVDAYDDIADDIASGSYNPLLYRYGWYDSKNETAKEFTDRIEEECEQNMLILCSEMAKMLDLLDIKKNNGIIENIVYMGLLRSTDNVLGKSRPGEENNNGD